jgi:hypothetical protein
MNLQGFDQSDDPKSKRMDIMHTQHRKHATSPQPAPAQAKTTTQAVIALSETNHKGKVVATEDIRLCAYRKWESAGKPAGNGIQFWLEAEKELVQGK